MYSGQASRIIGWVLLQIYEKKGKVHPIRNSKNWRVYDESEIDVLKQELLDELLERKPSV